MSEVESAAAAPPVAPEDTSKKNRLKIQKWDPSKIPMTSTIFLIGRRGTGKSTIIRDLCYHFRHRPDVAGILPIAVCPTEDTAEEGFQNFIPQSMIFKNYDERTIQRIMDTQKKMWKGGNGKYHILLILDDCVYDKKIFRSKLFRELMMNGRHRRLTVIVAVQYMLDCPPDIRANIDIVIAARDNIISNRKRLYENFAGFFTNQSEFNMVFSACTKNFEVLVIDNKSTSHSNDASDCVKWWKARRTLPDCGPQERMAFCGRADCPHRFHVGAAWAWRLEARFHCNREEEYEQQERREKHAAESGGPVNRVVKGDVMGNTVVADSMLGGFFR